MPIKIDPRLRGDDNHENSGRALTSLDYYLNGVGDNGVGLLETGDSGSGFGS
jgi:hypothetical protein